MGIILLLFGTIAHISTGLISPALQKIRAEYFYIEHIDLLSKLLITAPHLVIAILSPIVGFLITKVNRKIFLIIAPLIYVCVGIVSFLSDNIYTMIAMSGFLGVAIAMIVPTSTSIIFDEFDKTTRRTLIGLQTTFMSIGGIVFTILSGFISDINWHYVFLVYLLPAVLTPISYLFVHLVKEKREILIKAKANDERGYVGMFGIYGIVIFHMVMVYCIPLQLPILLGHFSFNSKQAGYCMAIETVCSALTAAYYGRLKKNYHHYHLCIAAFCIMALSFIVIGIAQHYLVFIIASCICGVGIGIMMPNNTMWLIHVVNSKYKNLALGFFTTAIYMGKFISGLFIHVTDHVFASFTACYLVGAVAMVLISIIIYITSRIRCIDDHYEAKDEYC